MDGQIRFRDISYHVVNYRKYYGHPRGLFLSYEVAGCACAGKAGNVIAATGG